MSLMAALFSAGSQRLRGGWWLYARASRQASAKCLNGDAIKLVAPEQRADESAHSKGLTLPFDPSSSWLVAGGHGRSAHREKILPASQARATLNSRANFVETATSGLSPDQVNHA